jgi:hypothetical protein
MKRLRHPIRAIREPFGTAGLVVACVALVAALGGTALAASALNGKQKKEVEKIAKKYAGKPGAAGAQGPAGPAGAAGKDGSNGSNGSAGAAGTGATATPFTGVKGSCTEGGVTIKSASPEANLCNGKEGEAGEQGPPGNPWTLGGTLPSEATETGTYILSSEGIDATAFVRTTISFPIPLAVGLDGSHVKFVNPTSIPAECESSQPGAAALDNPEAAPGFLCVFAGPSFNFVEPTAGEIFTVAGSPGADTVGALIQNAEGLATENVPAIQRGTWAVTAP